MQVVWFCFILRVSIRVGANALSMAILEDIEAGILAMQNERDAAIGAYKEKLEELKQQREAALAQQKVATMTDAEKESMRAALNQPPEQVINAGGVESNTQMGEIESTI